MTELYALTGFLKPPDKPHLTVVPDPPLEPCEDTYSCLCKACRAERRAVVLRRGELADSVPWMPRRPRAMRDAA